MKVVHIMAGDLSGGAARGTYWLHQALIQLGVDSRILINGSQKYDDPHIAIVDDSLPGRLWQGLSKRLGELPKVLYQGNDQYQPFDTGLGGSRYQANEIFRQADLVNLHHINGVASVRSLRSIRKPLVWTLRSMWPLTGGCHYSLDCDKYQTGCSACPQLGSTSPHDLSRFNARTKLASYPPHLQLVGVSNWITRCAGDSVLLRDFPIRTIHNGINTADFQPIDRNEAVRSLGLNPDTKYLLAIAQNFQNRYKGFDHLREALRFLNPSGTHLLIVGSVGQAQLNQLEFPHTTLGIVHDSPGLRAAYSAATVHVAPNRMETFGKTLVEAMACGTPVVSFDATGPKDIVEHKRSGYRAQAFSARSLAEGIQWVLGLDADGYNQLSTRARQQAIDRFDSTVVARQYLDLYQSMLNRAR